MGRQKKKETHCFMQLKALSPWQIPRFQVMAFSDSIWEQFGMKLGPSNAYFLLYSMKFSYLGPFEYHFMCSTVKKTQDNSLEWIRWH